MGTTLLTPNTAREEDREAAQRLACATMVRACERALYDLRCALGRAERPADVRSGLAAIDLLEQVLAGWRETLALCEPGPQLLPVDHPR
jgi:hypothetical protein